ncbi:hypothetical protein V493_07193 [Pseudogymnoascus sp. VKM F-4281 (FW-2241)]|nr:hypothetical protein V493_07193 [Pseudogymnoascus sp. VKM F-4281 (FW-2241)]
MRRLVAFWALLLDIRYVGVHAQKAVWKTPVKGEGLKPNTIDTVLLDWTSTLPTTILRMWCQNKTDANNLFLASSFYVESNGPFEYIMEDFLQDNTEFPLACHAELAEKPVGAGTDCPAAIVWSSNAAEAAKTVSQTKAAPTVTVTPSPSSTPPSSTPSPTPSSTPESSSADSTITGSPSKSTTAISSTGTEESAKPSTNSSDSSTTLPTENAENPSAATTAPIPAASSSPNNIGAIVGGAIGGVALISFIILAVLFLRKFQRNRAATPVAAESTRRSFYLFNSHNKRGLKARTTGVFEKEGEYGLGIQEKEASGVPRNGRIYELPENRGERRFSPVELPGSSIYRS